MASYSDATMTEMGAPRHHEGATDRDAFYDVAVIGSGPINLMEALHEARRGARVLVVEQRAVLGGAWYTASSWGYENLEVGCHKIENHKPAYDLIESLGVEMWVMEPQPRLMIRGLPTNKGVAWAIFYATVKTMNRLRGGGDLIAFSLHDRLRFFLLGRWRWVLRDYEYKYFDSGCVVMVKALVDAARKAGVEIVTGCAAKEIHVEDGTSWIALDDRRVRFGRCVVNKNSWVRVFVGPEEVTLRRKELHGRHVLLKINGRKLVDFLHLDILNGPLLRQVQDVGYYVRSDELILCANVLRRAAAVQNQVPVATEPLTEQEEQELIADVFQALKADGLIAAGSVLLDAFVERYAICSNDDRDLAGLATRTSNRVNVVWTADLADGIRRQLPRWRTFSSASRSGSSPGSS